MSLKLSPEQMAFRREVRTFVRGNLTDDLRRAWDLTSGVFAEPDVSQRWHKLLHARGWIAPLWPREFGGPGWSPIEHFIFESECAEAGAPIVYPMGLQLVGPVIFTFGSADQKEHYLPRILSGEDYWCQGFSEPGAGSDLASLATRAISDGDDYIVNGSKIWTTHAHHSNLMFALVRTADTARRQDGISFLIIDMAAPGVEVRPIVSIGGDHDVNQVFFTDVRVPKTCRIGDENMGWSYAKFLLEFERGSGFVAPRLRAGFARIERAIDDLEAEGRSIRRDAKLMARLAAVAIDVDAFEMLELKTLGSLSPGENPGPVSSMLKLRASRMRQAIAEIGVELIGRDALRIRTPAAEPRDALAADYLNSRAVTIFGGASEVQLGIIARSLDGAA